MTLGKSSKRDPLFKINYFINTIIDNSNLVYTPTEFLAIDESMIKYRGKNHMKIYVLNKPIKWGFRAFVLCESNSGYVLRWFLDKS